MARPILIAGNWKMNEPEGALKSIGEIAIATRLHAKVEIVLFPPATLLARASLLTQATALRLGAQDCSTEASGSYTGELSASILKSGGASFVLIGHSERRTRHAESNDTVCRKAVQAIQTGLTAVICVGETLEEKDADRTFDILADQIAQSIPKKETDRIVVAYEPMWAIGTGNTPPLIGQAHKYIRSVLLSQLGSSGIDVPVIYGGSVKPSNAFEILQIDDVGGLLVGGASLDAGQFKAIFQAALISNSETA